MELRNFCGRWFGYLKAQIFCLVAELCKYTLGAFTNYVDKTRLVGGAENVNGIAEFPLYQ